MMSQLCELIVTNEQQCATAHTGNSDSAGLLKSIARDQHEIKDTLDQIMRTICRPSFVDGHLQPHNEPLSSSIPPQRGSAGTLTWEQNPGRKDLLSLTVTKTDMATRGSSSGCPCPCHVRSSWKTPRLLQQITGYLLLGYSGRSVLWRNCISSCLHSDSVSTQMTYFFPRWFVNRAVSFALSSDNLGAPTLNIKVRRVVPEASQLFSLSKFDDIEGLQALFDRRLASPDDVHFYGGWTALHVSTHPISQVGYTRG